MNSTVNQTPETIRDDGGQVKLTKAQTTALEMMHAIGSMYPCRAAGHTNSFTSLVRRGMAARIGVSGPFNITEAGRNALLQAGGKLS